RGNSRGLSRTARLIDERRNEIINAMNKPLDPHVLRPDALGHLTAEAAELDLPPDDIAQSSTRLYLSGIQALVHLPILQRLRDQAAGLNTAGFISGYRGSPL